MRYIFKRCYYRVYRRRVGPPTLYFPQTYCTFAGLDIVLSGDPAQLAPIRVYAHRGSTQHLSAPHIHHLFDEVVLDQHSIKLEVSTISPAFYAKEAWI